MIRLDDMRDVVATIGTECSRAVAGNLAALSGPEAFLLRQVELLAGVVEDLIDHIEGLGERRDGAGDEGICDECAARIERGLEA